MKRTVKLISLMLLYTFFLCIASYAQKFSVTVSDLSNVTVVSDFSPTEKMEILLCRRGANNLFDFHSWKVFDKKGKALFSAVNDSDCFSPYVVFANNRAAGDNRYTYDFTGGNHDYSNHDNGKSPTARSEYVAVYVDGEYKSDYNGWAETLEIKVSNLVQGSNTKRENGAGKNVLREQITLTFDGKVWSVGTKITALCDLTLRRYYGYCLSASAFGDRVEYLYPHRKSYNHFYNFYDSDSTTKDCNGMYLSGGKVDVLMTISENADEKSFNTSDYSAFFTNYGKMYFNIIYGNKPKIMSKGETFEIGGSYEFLKPEA